MIDYLYLLGVFIFAFVFRSMLRVIFKKDIDFDTYFHLYLIEFIRNNGTNNLIELKRFIKPFGLNYPWMMHFFISLYPKKFDMLFERFFNPFLDSLFSVFLYIGIFYITESDNQAIIVAILYLFTPAMFTTLSLGPRIKSFTPRLFGEIVGGSVFIFEYMYFIFDNYIYLLVAIFFSSLTYLSSKFSVQALVFISSCLFIFTLEIEYIIVLLGGFVLSMIYSRGNYYEVLKQQLGHLKWYFFKNIRGEMGISDRNSIYTLINFLKTGEYKRFIKSLLFRNTFIIVLTRFPFVYISLYFIFIEYQITNQLQLIDYFIISSVIIFIVTSLKWFLFIGEAERYLNYVVFFVFFKIVPFFDNNLVWLNFFMIYGLLFYILDFILVRKKKINYNKLNKILIQWLNKHDKKLNIATIPYHLGGWSITYETNHNWLYHLVWIDKESKKYLDDNYTLKYPYLDIDKADKIIEEYKLDYIIYDKSALIKDFKNYNLPDNLKHIKISENIYALYK